MKLKVTWEPWGVALGVILMLLPLIIMGCYDKEIKIESNGQVIKLERGAYTKISAETSYEMITYGGMYSDSHFIMNTATQEAKHLVLGYSIEEDDLVIGKIVFRIVKVEPEYLTLSFMRIEGKETLKGSDQEAKPKKEKL